MIFERDGSSLLVFMSETCSKVILAEELQRQELLTDHRDLKAGGIC